MSMHSDFSNKYSFHELKIFRFVHLTHTNLNILYCERLEQIYVLIITKELHWYSILYFLKKQILLFFAKTIFSLSSSLVKITPLNRSIVYYEVGYIHCRRGGVMYIHTYYRSMVLMLKQGNSGKSKQYNLNTSRIRDCHGVMVLRHT